MQSDLFCLKNSHCRRAFLCSFICNFQCNAVLGLLHYLEKRLAQYAWLKCSIVFAFCLLQIRLRLRKIKMNGTCGLPLIYHRSNQNQKNKCVNIRWVWVRLQYIDKTFQQLSVSGHIWLLAVKECYRFDKPVLKNLYRSHIAFGNGAAKKPILFSFLRRNIGIIWINGNCESKQRNWLFMGVCWEKWCAKRFLLEISSNFE